MRRDLLEEESALKIGENTNLKDKIPDSQTPNNYQASFDNNNSKNYQIALQEPHEGALNKSMNADKFKQL